MAALPPRAENAKVTRKVIAAVAMAALVAVAAGVVLSETRAAGGQELLAPYRSAHTLAAAPSSASGCLAAVRARLHTQTPLHSDVAYHPPFFLFTHFGKCAAPSSRTRTCRLTLIACPANRRQRATRRARSTPRLPRPLRPSTQRSPIKLMPMVFLF